jgi:HK97 family phage prohead protease
MNEELKHHVSELEALGADRKKVSLIGTAIRLPDPDGDRLVTFRANTRTIDRHRTRVEPRGGDLSNYRSNPIFLWGHDGYGGWFSVPQMEHVLGRAVDITQSDASMDIKTEFASKAINPKADMALGLVRGGFLNAVSIGFIPRKVVVEMEDGIEVPIIKEWELLEVSLVPIPSNPEALAVARAMFEADAAVHPDAFTKNLMPALTRRLAQQPEIRAQWQEILSACPTRLAEEMDRRGAEPSLTIEQVIHFMKSHKDAVTPEMLREIGVPETSLAPEPPAQPADPGSGSRISAIRRAFLSEKIRQGFRSPR